MYLSWLLLQHLDSFWGGGLVVAPHVVVHFWETFLHVILGAALSHRAKAETHGRVMQLGTRHGEVWILEGGEAIKEGDGADSIMRGV